MIACDHLLLTYLCYSMLSPSGLVYLLMEWLMASIIIACWSNKRIVGFIKFLKFVELTADNMVVITNLAICANLAFIVAVRPACSFISDAVP